MAIAPWVVSDELWSRIEPLLPKVERRFRYPGRKRLPDRQALQGILFVLYTGIAWRHLPPELGFGGGSTCHRRMDEWQRAGVWERLHELLLAELRAAGEIEWSRAVADSSHVQAKKFVAVTLVGGNCTVTAALLNCTLGTIGPGVERMIQLSARVTQTGTYVNSATGTGDGKDTNGANNTDNASTLVTAPMTPPTTSPKPPVKPTPKPKPILNICRVLKVTPGMVKASGKAQIVLAKVTRSRNPVSGVAVRFSGTGFAKVVRTNKQGIARLTLTPSKAGIMLVKITSAKACNSARIGVVGVFEPPVTARGFPEPALDRCPRLWRGATDASGNGWRGRKAPPACAATLPGLPRSMSGGGAQEGVGAPGADLA